MSATSGRTLGKSCSLPRPGETCTRHRQAYAKNDAVVPDRRSSLRHSVEQVVGGIVGKDTLFEPAIPNHFNPAWSWIRGAETVTGLMGLFATLYRTADRVYPESTWGELLARGKYCVRGILAAGPTSRWFRLLESPYLVGATHSHPRIFSKLQRPYLHRRLGLRARLAVLEEHYSFVINQLTDAARQAIFTDAGFEVASIHIDGSKRYSVCLRYMDQFEKEGELTAVLIDTRQDVTVFVISFTITRWKGEERELFIGGLQGQMGASDRESVVQLTRTLHGLRPKALLVFVVQRLAQCWQINRLRAVGDSEHIYRHFRKRREIFASYDTFWEECNGVLDPDGNYSLPERPTIRRIDELPAKKRPLYRRRYAMLEELGAIIARRIQPGHFEASVPSASDQDELRSLVCR